MDSMLVKLLHLSALMLFVGSLTCVCVLAATGTQRKDGGLLQIGFRLNRMLVTPTFITAFLAGLLLAWLDGYLTEVWLWLKLAIVMGLGALHGVLSGRLRRRARGDAPRPGDDAVFRLSVLLVPGLVTLIIAVVLFRPGF